MSARDEILARLRSQARRVEPPPVWESKRAFEDLAARFEQALGANGGELRRAESLDEAWAQLDALLSELGAERAVANDEPPLDAIDPAARWPGVDWHVVGRSEGDLRAACAAADVGLSGAAAALAETGSVVLESGPGRSRLCTLLPAVHVALVSTTQLTADLFTWAAERGQPPAALTFVSGPSKTADIGQTLSVGVHGPKRFIVLLYQRA